jgi:hypothetical protein
MDTAKYIMRSKNIQFEMPAVIAEDPAMVLWLKGLFDVMENCGGGVCVPEFVTVKIIGDK